MKNRILAKTKFRGQFQVQRSARQLSISNPILSLGFEVSFFFSKFWTYGLSTTPESKLKSPVLTCPSGEPNNTRNDFMLLRG